MIVTNSTTFDPWKAKNLFREIDYGQNQLIESEEIADWLRRTDAIERKSTSLDLVSGKYFAMK